MAKHGTSAWFGFGFHVLVLVEWILVPWLTPHDPGASHVIVTFVQLHLRCLSLGSIHVFVYLTPGTSAPGGVSSSPKLDFSQGR